MCDTNLTGMALLRSRRGSLARIAEALNISRNAPSMWRDVPAEHLIKIEEVTGFSRELLRPDLYAPRRARQDEAGAAQPVAA